MCRLQAQFNQPLDDLARLTTSNLSDLDTWRKKANVIAAKAGGLEMIARAEKIYADRELAKSHANEEEEEHTLSQALHCLDLLGEAKRSSRECNVYAFCRIKVLEGKIYLHNLLNRKKAKNCFREALDLGLSESLESSTWFWDATQLFDEIKKEEAKEEAKMAPDPSHVLNELKAEMTQLNGMDSLSDSQFYAAVLDKFPPRHRKQWAITEKEKGSMKRLYCKMSVYYHPDKVDKEEFGEKYKVLVEEISKRINCRYNNIKAEE